MMGTNSRSESRRAGVKRWQLGCLSDSQQNRYGELNTRGGDDLIDGGGGLDVAQVLGSQGVTLNLSASNIEIAVGGSGNDVFIGGGRSTVFVRGGGTGLPANVPVHRVSAEVA